MKLRIIKLTNEQFVSLLQGKLPAALKLPNDLELYDVKLNLFERQVCMVVRSESFSDVADGVQIPLLEQQPKPLPQPTASLLPQPKVGIAKTVVPSKSALKMENEFSPEQRKLLSFTVKGDMVVVKPTQFLKAEWEDINEVVKSLGGRWVKGDILSYWEIPVE